MVLSSLQMISYCEQEEGDLISAFKEILLLPFHLYPLRKKLAT